MSRTVVGIDFGTLSGRAVVVSVADGKILASAEHTYPHGVIDRELAGRPLPPDWALQVPADYVEVLGRVVPEALEASGVAAADVVGLAVDSPPARSSPPTRPTGRCANDRSSRNAPTPTRSCGNTTHPSGRERS